MFDKISTTSLSFSDAFRAACMTRTSIFFKVCYMATLLAPLCAVLAQGAVTLLVLPYPISQEIDIPSIVMARPIEVPWSTDQTLAPYNAAEISFGQLGTSWTYLEQITGSIVGDIIPPGYLVPLRTSTNNTAGSQYPTDVAKIRCKCSWLAPRLPPASDTLGVNAIQTAPNGIASEFLPVSPYAFISLTSCIAFAPLSNVTFFNGTPVTSGMFTWTLWYVGF
jgi:hypothetical protein